MVDYRISDLTAGTPPYDGGTLLEASVPDGLGGFNSRKALYSDLVPVVGPSLIVNREFLIDQRGEGAAQVNNLAAATTPPTNGWLVDEWFSFNEAGSDFSYTAQRIANPGRLAGFSAALRLIFNAASTTHEQAAIGQASLANYGINDPSAPSAIVQDVWAVLAVWASQACSITVNWINFNNNAVFSHLVNLSAGNNLVQWLIPGTSSFSINSGGGNFVHLWFAPQVSPLQTPVEGWQATTFDVPGPQAGQTNLVAAGATLDILGFDMRPANGPFPFVHGAWTDYFNECSLFYLKSYLVGGPINLFVGIVPGTARGSPGSCSFGSTGLDGSGNAFAMLTLPNILAPTAAYVYDSAGTAGKVDYFSGGIWHAGGTPGFVGLSNDQPATLTSIIVLGPVGATSLAFELVIDGGF